MIGPSIATSYDVAASVGIPGYATKLHPRQLATISPKSDKIQDILLDNLWE